MITITGIDITRLNVGVHQAVRALGVKTADFVFVRAGLLVKRLTLKSLPTNLAKAQKQADLDVKRSLYPVSGKLFTGRKAKKTTGGGRWMYAYPKNESGHSGLVGVGAKDWKPNADGLLLHRTEQKRQKGPRWLTFGKRGNQRVQIIDKPVVAKSVYKKTVRAVRESFGKIKAAFASCWAPLRVTGSIPNWIAKHIPGQIAKGCRVIPDLKGDKPNITIIVRAKGIEGKKQLSIIRGGLKAEFYAMKKDVQLYLSGVKKLSDFGKGVLK